MSGHPASADHMLPGGPGKAGTAPPVVIVGLDSITGLQVARVLAARGVPVVGIADDASHHAARTRAVGEVIAANTRAAGPLLEALSSLAPRLGEAVLLPTHDAGVFALSAHRDELPATYRYSLPPHEVVETLADKARLATFAGEFGFPIPPTVVVRTRAEARDAAGSINYPAVLKPARKDYRWIVAVQAKAFRVTSRRELLDAHERLSPFSDTFVVQEWIPGGDGDIVGCYIVFDEGSRPLVTFVSRKIRQWPPHTGSTSLCEERRDDAALAMALDVFARVPYRGIGHVELKRDARTRALKIVEVNVGRATIRTCLAEAAGVPLHETLYRDLAGLPLPRDRQQRYAGMKWLYLKNDTLAAFTAWSQGALSMGEWWRSWRGQKFYADFSWTDPVPFWLDVSRTTARILRRRAHAAVQRIARHD